MSDKDFNAAEVSGDITKVKRFKKSDIFVFITCLIISMVIWVCAKNAEFAKKEEMPELPDHTEMHTEV